MDINDSYNIIHNLCLSFFKGIQYKMEAEEIEKMTWQNQEKFLQQTVQSLLFKKYPCDRKFCVLFFKKLIQYLESQHEVHDDIYEFLCSVMKSNDNLFIYRHYVIKNDLNNIITIKETKSMVVNGTTGLRTWEAALMLTDWALFNNQLFLNMNVLELGSGVGFTGITIAKQCDIQSMIMTDCHSDVLSTIDSNIHINFSSLNPKNFNPNIYESGNKTIGSMMLDWNEIEDISLNNTPDIVIGADIVYDPSILEPLINLFTTLHKLNNNVDIYIASVVRNKDTFSQFLNTLEKYNFKHQNITIGNFGYIDWNDSIERSLLKINKR